MTDRLPPLHPGELLREEFLRPMDLSACQLADAIGSPLTPVIEILAGEQPISRDMDRRLCRFFQLSDGYWLRAQDEHDRDARHAGHHP